MSAYLRLRIDAGQEPAEIDGNIDVYVSLPGGDEDNIEPQVQFRFSDEGIITDAFEGGACLGTSSETYTEIAERLRAAPDPTLYANAERAIRRAAKAAEGDSNDSEIGLLWDAVYAIAALAGIDADKPRFNTDDD